MLNLGTHGQGIDREIFLDVKTGVEAKNYDDVSLSFTSFFYKVLFFIMFFLQIRV